MSDIDRSEAERLLRKNQNTLVIVGRGVIVFGVWSIAKVVMSILFFEEFRSSLLNDRTAEEPLAAALIWIIIALMLGVIFALRLGVGLPAISEGRGGKARWAYLVLASLIALTDAVGLVANFVWYSDSYHSVMDAVVSVVVELTNIVTMAELIVSGVRVKRLARLLEEGA